MTLRLSDRWGGLAGWILLAIGLLATLPGLVGRVQVESTNATYELSADAQDIAALAAASADPDEPYRRLADAGLASVAVEMETLGGLETAGRVTILTRAQLIGQLHFAGIPASEVPNGDAVFVALTDEDPAVARALSLVATVTPVEIAGLPLLQVEGLRDLRDVVIGFDEDRIRDLADRGFGIIARVPAAASTLEPRVVLDELARLHDRFGVSRIAFSGDSAPYVDDPEALRAFATGIRDLGYDLLLIELIEQVGDERYFPFVGRAIRLHPLDLAQVHGSAAVERAIRAVKERNMRIVFLRPTAALSAEGRLEELTDVLSGIRTQMPASFHPGIAQPFGHLERSALVVTGALLASAAIGWMGGVLLAPWAGAVLAAGVLLGGAAWIVTGADLLGDLLRLGVAVLGATVAVLSARPRRSIGPATVQYLKAAAIVTATGLVVTALALEDRFLVGAADFFGVKALLVAPLGIVALIAAYRSLDRPGLRDLPRLARSPVEVWQVAAAVVVGAAVWYLLLRSGNTGAASSWELSVRQTLENILYVRPRTKEFLVGFPALLLAITLTARTRFGWWAYAVAAIGTASAIDSFTHYHTPLLVSLLRTAYAVGFGFLIGLVVLGVLGLFYRGIGRLRRAW